MDESVFDGYVCGVTGNPCCGCSLYCEHRRPKNDLKGILGIASKDTVPVFFISICRGRRDDHER